MITIEKLNLQLDQDTLAKYLAAGILEQLARGERTAIRAQEQPVQTSGATPALGELWPGEGGHYVGILPAIGDRPAMYMIAGAECADRLKWGPYDETALATSRHDGRANTQALIVSRDKYPAAWWCANQQHRGCTDWHLPSQAELFMALLNAPGAFEKEGWYWSSTQGSRYFAFAQAFEYGNSGWYVKDGEFRVRAFRWIPLNP